MPKFRPTVECEIEECETENENGNSVPSVKATCGKCGHCTTSFGTGPASIRRCLALLHEDCPNGENNFYVEE